MYILIFLSNLFIILVYAFRGDIAKTRKRYLELGQYDYEGEEYLENFGEKIGTNTNGLKYHYIGHFKKGTNGRDGIGISVTENEYTILLFIIFLIFTKAITRTIRSTEPEGL